MAARGWENFMLVCVYRLWHFENHRILRSEYEGSDFKSTVFYAMLLFYILISVPKIETVQSNFDLRDFNLPNKHNFVYDY